MDNGPKSMFSQASRPKKYFASFGLIFCAFVMGICLCFLNPVVIDFSHKLNESIDRVSVVFTVITAAYLVGALCSGIIPNFLPRQFWVMLVVTMMAVPLFIFPFVKSILIFYVLAAVMGFGVGGFDAAQASWTIDIWRHEAPPFILMVHFAYSAGTLVPPLIQAPFLPEDSKEHGLKTGANTTEFPYESQLQTPFLIGGSIAILGAVTQIALYFFVFRNAESVGVNPNAPNEIELEAKSKEVGPNPDSGSLLNRKVLLIGLFCCVVGFYSGLEVCTSQFIPTFSHYSEVGLSEKDSANISFGLQLGFAIGRFCGIFLVLRIAPHFILAGNFVLLLVSNTILLVYAGSDVTWLWVGSVMIGLGMSTAYGTLYSYIERYVFVTDRIASTVAVCGGLVAAIYPIVVGKWIDGNPEVLTYVNFLSIFVSGVAFSILFYVTHVKSTQKRRQ